MKLLKTDKKKTNKRPAPTDGDNADEKMTDQVKRARTEDKTVKEGKKTKKPSGDGEFSIKKQKQGSASKSPTPKLQSYQVKSNKDKKKVKKPHAKWWL